ncbi:MAG: ATP-grasp domain-containing protein [Gammaproteobacteria bacterium]|nr:MAG: ATP-grasp domain-containing protein [Gammaproteobacteria bacterium]
MSMEACILAKNLLIVGGGAEQIPAYLAAKRRGLHVIGSDMNPEAPAFAHADARLLASTRDADATVQAARAYHRTHPIDGVMTIANDVPYTVARVAHALGLPSIPLSAAAAVVDKQRMKECFRAQGVACPWFTPVDSADALRTIIEKEGPEARFVLKPVDGRGARGVLLLDARSDLEWAFQESWRWGESGRLLLERFVPGMQLSTESFLLDGRIHTPAIAERNYGRMAQFLPNIIEDGGTIPAPLDDGLRQAIDELILRGAKALGIDSGIIKGDIVIDSRGRPLIIELAARLSGGWLATHQIPAATGVSLVDAVISHALGEPIDPSTLTPRRHRATAIRYWFPPPGRIERIAGEEALKSVPGLIDYGFFRGEGDIQPEIRMHPDRFGYVIVSGKDREQALERVEQALACLHIEVTP